MILTFLLLIIVTFPEFSKKVGGARRWLTLGGFSFQPSELAKFTLVLFIAKSLVKRADKLRNFAYGYLPNLIVLGFFFIPILFQPDFGTAMIICAVTLTMLFIAGLRKKFLFLSILAIVPFITLAIMTAEYRTKRILAFLKPWEDPSGINFQVIQSFYAFGRGGFWGTGLGQSSQKLFRLPEAHTDFIFSVIGEELGFMGTTVIVILFSIFIWRGFITAYRAKDPFGTHLATGLTLLIGLQAFINLGVASGLLPTKGLTLPFISMGGSSMLVTMLSVGVLLNISKQAKKR
jgi:cell division protein FtsW